MNYSIKNILIYLFLIISLPANSQTLESGAIYKFNNVGKPGNSLSISEAVPGAVGSPSNDNDLKQQWYLVADEESSGFYFRNVSNGAYLTSPKKIYTQWPMTFTNEPDKSSMLFSITPYEDNFVIHPVDQSSGYAFAHNDASNNIVCWLASSTPTQWTYEKIPATETEIQEILDRFATTGDEIAKAEIYETNLDAIFSDKACTKLKKDDEMSGNPDYINLPSTLQKMVDKMLSDDWSEKDGDWNSDYAKKYRVQLYEPYSEGAAAAGLAGIQPYTNMNNPTGIIANAGEILYVMVEDEVPEGATLYMGGVPDCNMHNSVTAGSPLKRGLNMIMCNADLTHFFIYYTVNTIENKVPVRSLKNYNPIKIHIEGGRINGFFNYVGDELYSGDTRDDFLYTSQRALHPMYDLIGKYVILHFFLEDTPNMPGESVKQLCVKSALDPQLNPGETKNYDPAAIMKAWDDMCFSERILMGIQSDEDIKNPFNQGMYESIVNDNFTLGDYNGDPGFFYSDYFNNRMMGITLQASGLYMNATSWRTAYAPGTVSAILAQFPQDGIWGPAHEYGHINQTPMRIAGTTEESNNVFSNVANYFLCKTTSRCDYPSAQLKIFNEGKTYLENGTWGTTRMFWQLWCYYHATKHNTKFYPRLYELLRKYPLKRDLESIPGKLNPKTDLLHFAKMCCVAAEEDLTDFFTAWGFFVPQDNYHIDDYDVYDCILTQEDIDEVKQEIAAMNLPKNQAIILIDDRPGSTLPVGFGYDKELCGDLGGLQDFIGGVKASGNLSFVVEDMKVTVSGEGNPGVGFLVFDSEDNLIGFSNSYSFELSKEASQALLNGTASLKAVSADNSMLDVTNLITNGSLDEKKELLKNLIDSCIQLLSMKDDSLTHVGMLLPDSCTQLESACEEAEYILENSEDTEKLTEEYLLLSDLYFDLIADDNAYIQIIDGAAYMLVNNYYPSFILDAGENELIATKSELSIENLPLNQQWIFKSTGNEDSSQFFIINRNDGRYIETTNQQSTKIPLGEEKQPYSVVTIERGIYAFAPDNKNKFCLHIDASKNVVQWNSPAAASHWKLIKTYQPDADDENSSIDYINQDNTISEFDTFDVYDLSGAKLKSNVNIHNLKSLKHGLYILKKGNKSIEIIIN